MMNDTKELAKKKAEIMEVIWVASRMWAEAA